jgi:hypothetical protein
MWKQLKAGGFGAALRLPDKALVRVQGVKPTEAGEFSAFQKLNFEFPEKEI